MTVEEFAVYKKTGKYPKHSVVIVEDPDFQITPNQACGIEELMIRQSQGLPMPNLTPIVHTAYNDYDIDNLPITAKLSADVIDVMKQIEEVKGSIDATEEKFKYEVADALSRFTNKN